MTGNFLYSIKQALKQIWRNKAMGLASVFSISAMLLILGLFFVIIVNVNITAETIKKDYDSIEVFLLDQMNPQEQQVLLQEVAEWEHVTSVEYRSKEAAMEILKARWGENAYLLESLQENPLPNSIIVKVSSLEKAGDVAEKLGTLGGVEDVKYYQEVVDKLLKVTDFFEVGAVVIMAFLLIVSIVVVSNTIKLTVFNRSEEIMIMKYVGATNWFIRGPFLVEGIIIGLISALVSSGLVLLLYKELIEIVGKEMLSVLSVSLVPLGFLSYNLLWIFIAIGVSVGAFGSIISMRRFLDT